MRREQPRKRENYFIVYKDGNSEWIDLQRHTFKLLSVPDEPSTRERVEPPSPEASQRSVISGGTIPSVIVTTTRTTTTNRQEPPPAQPIPHATTQPMAARVVSDIKVEKEQAPSTTRDSPPLPDESAMTPKPTAIASPKETTVKQPDRPESNHPDEPNLFVRRGDRAIITETKDTLVIDPDTKNAQTALIKLVSTGTRLSIYWEDEQQYYNATVSDTRTGRCFVEYDDGEEEWIDLRNNKFRIIQELPKKRRSFGSTSCMDDTPRRTTSNVAERDLLTGPSRGRRKKHTAVPKTPEFDSDSDESEPLESETAASIVTVGTRVAVWWALDEMFYCGTITKERDGKKNFFLAYDDGKEEEWINLDQHQFKVLTAAPETKKRGRRKTEENVCHDASRVQVGSRVAIWWDNVHQYFVGTVKRRRDNHERDFFIDYDVGGMSHWINFNRHTYRIVNGKQSSSGQRKIARKRNPEERDVETPIPRKKKAKADRSQLDTPARRKSMDSVFSLELPKKRPVGRPKKLHDATSKKSKAPSAAKDDHLFRIPHKRPKSSHARASTANYRVVPSGPGSKKKKYTKQKFEDADSPALVITVGTRVSVYWEGEQKYFKGVVTRERKTGKQRHYLEYDDGEAAHWIDFREHWVRILDDSKKKRNKKGKDKKPKASRHEPADREPEVEVGSSVDIWWSGDKLYYRGKVIELNGKNAFVVYEDGEKEWVNLSRTKYRLLTRASDHDADGSDDPLTDSESENTAQGHDAASEESSEGETEMQFDDDEQPTKKKAAKKKGKREEAKCDPDDEDYMDPYEYNDFVYGAVDDVEVGTRLSVWWTKEKYYYDCVVKEYDDDSRKPYFLRYDDGDEEWTDLRRRYFRFID